MQPLVLNNVFIPLTPLMYIQ